MELKEIEKAAHRLNTIIHHIPLSSSRTFSDLCDCDIFLKCENRQKTGSFKVRGAYNKLASMIEQGEKPTSVVTSSAGNHAQGVAFAAQALGIAATIVMPRTTPIAKVLATRDYGANVELYGECYDDAYTRAIEIRDNDHAVFIHPFDDPAVIAGQGTMGVEILRDLPNVDTVIIPAGGGGLLAGLSYYIKAINPRVEVIGVQSEGAPAIVKSFNAGVLKQSKKIHTVADGIAVKAPGELTFALIKENVDKMITVSDAEISAAILLLLERTKQVVEPAGAASLAAALNFKTDLKNKRVVTVLSGGNIDVSLIHKIVEQGLIKRGRLIRFQALMRDVPGSLTQLSQIVSDCGANIILVDYDRMHAELDINEAILHVACEVSGLETSQLIVKQLREAGYVVSME